MTWFVFYVMFFFFLMIRRPPRSTQSRSSAASDVYKRQASARPARGSGQCLIEAMEMTASMLWLWNGLSLIHISEPTRLGMISYAVFCLKKKKQKNNIQKR